MKTGNAISKKAKLLNISRINRLNYQVMIINTSFIPYFSNETTSVARMNISINQPHYLIKMIKNEVMRLIRWGIQSSIEVVLYLKLGKNKVRSDLLLTQHYYKLLILHY